MFVLTDDCAGTVLDIVIELSGKSIDPHDQIFVVNFTVMFFSGKKQKVLVRPCM